MRALALGLALACCSAPATRGGVVSTNPCADAMLVRLVPPGRIAAISHYSQEPGATSMPLAVARRFHATAGTAEEVIALRPALVLTSSFTPPATRDAYARAGLRTLVLDAPATVAASEAQVREVAAALGERGRGEAMVGEMERSAMPAASPSEPPVSSHQHPQFPGVGRGPVTPVVVGGIALPASRPPLGPGLRRGTLEVLTTEARVSGARERSGERVPTALLFLSGDLATGSGTLLDELLTRAGFRDAAANYGLRLTGRVPIEAIAAHPPDVILAPDTGRTAALRRRVLARLGARTVEANFPRALINCGGPTIPPALARLRAVRAALP